jgi:hypothetical protein
MSGEWLYVWLMKFSKLGLLSRIHFLLDNVIKHLKQRRSSPATTTPFHAFDKSDMTPEAHLLLNFLVSI